MRLITQEGEISLRRAQHRLKIEETSTNNEKQLYKIYLYLVVTSLKATLFIVSVTTEAWLIDFFVLGAI